MNVARFMTPMGDLIELSKNGVDFWIVVTTDGLTHGVRYPLNIDEGFVRNVSTCCDWSYGKEGQAATLARGVPTCVACVVSRYPAQR